MRIIKPQKLGLIHRTFTVESVHTFAVAPLIFFDLLDPGKLVSESLAWEKLMRALPANQGLDEGMPKANAEFVLVGKAYAPNKKSVVSIDAAVSIGESTKELRVTGNRIWNKGFFRRYSSPPAPFKSLPLTWENTFGGADLATNPVGSGTLGSGRAGESIVALPNVSYPNELLKSPKGRIRPASFGPIDVSWQPRREFSGTYDDEYFERHFPGLTPDLDFRIYNLAPQDQQLSTRFRGDERFRLINLHPDHDVIEGALPGLHPRVFRDNAGGFNEIETALETVWFLPEVNLGAMIFRGTDPSERRHASMATDHLMVVYENLKDTAQTVGHFESVLRKRMDPKTSLEHLGNESELSPVKSEAVLAEETQELAREVKRQNDAQDTFWQQYRIEHKEKTGEDLSDDLKPTPIDSNFVIAPEAIARGDVDASRFFSVSEEKIKEANVSLNKSLKDTDSKPPESDEKPSSNEVLISEAVNRATDRDKVDDELWTGKGLEEQSAEKIEELHELKLSARRLSITPSSNATAAVAIVGNPLRAVVLELIKTQGSLLNRDLTGANLSKLDFSGQALDGSLLESADLRGANFMDASLTNVSFVGALLDSTDFSNSDLSRSNFNSSIGCGVNFSFANCTEMQCQGAQLIDSDFREAHCEGMIALDATLTAAEFTGSCLKNSSFMNADLSGSDFFNIEIERCTFLNANLAMTRWHRVNAANSALYNTKMQLVSMVDCKFKKVQFAGETSFTGSTLRETLFEECGFRGLAGCNLDLTESSFIGCDLGQVAMPDSKMNNVIISGCHADGADFSNGSLKGSTFTMSQFAETDFSNCELDGVNFYESDVLLSNLSNTEYKGALNLMPLKLRRLNDERRRVA